jgi:hypothetical protein
LHSERGALYLSYSPGPVVGRVFSLRDAPDANSPHETAHGPNITSNRADQGGGRAWRIKQRQVVLVAEAEAEGGCLECCSR